MDQRGVGNADRRTPDILEMLPYVDLEESASHHLETASGGPTSKNIVVNVENASLCSLEESVSHHSVPWRRVRRIIIIVGIENASIGDDLTFEIWMSGGCSPVA